MIASISVERKLFKLKEYTGYLKTCRKCSLKQIKEDHILQGAVLHYLQLSIESMLDIGELVISELRLPRPEIGRDVFFILAKSKIFSSRFAGKIAPMVGMRNILVHEYDDIDLAKVYGCLQNNLEDFAMFAKHVAKFMQRKQ